MMITRPIGKKHQFRSLPFLIRKSSHGILTNRFWLLLTMHSVVITLCVLGTGSCCYTTALAWTTRGSNFPLNYHKTSQQKRNNQDLIICQQQRRRQRKWHSFLGASHQSVNHYNNGNDNHCSSLGGNLVSVKSTVSSRNHPYPSTDTMIPKWEVVPTMNDYQTVRASNDVERLGLEAIVPGAFLANHVWTPSQCDDAIQTVRDLSSSTTSSILNIEVPTIIANRITQTICPMMDLKHVNTQNENDIEYIPLGISTLWTVYQNIFPTNNNNNNYYQNDQSMPNVPSPNISPRWNVYMNLSVPPSSSLTTTITIYKKSSNDNHNERTAIASLEVKPGSVLVVPDTSLFHVEYDPSSIFIQTTIDSTIARQGFHTDNNPLTGFSTDDDDDDDDDSLLWKYDELVRSTFIPQSPIFSSTFLHHTSNLYNPHMGVENIGVLLYSFVRFAKVQNIVEIGAGYTTIYLLQALHDNYEEMSRIQTLQQQDQCRLLNIPWSIPPVVNDFLQQEPPPKLRCIDNCLHQRETATGAQAVAKLLGLDSYLQFVQGDVFEDSIHNMLFGQPSSSNGRSGIDLLWCDFGVGSRMKEFASKTWSSIRPGGFLLCHSTLTNTRTRAWLEAIRRHDSEDITGIPPNEYTELSLLEEHKRFQNSITILQKRSNDYSEPIYSEYA